jgi:mono/diheme cytochrome c family protein
VKKFLIIGLAAVLGFAYWLFSVPAVSEQAIPDNAEAVARGEYLAAAGGCISCHAGVQGRTGLSGGLGLESEFGTFYAPNITPDAATGIGGWSARDFLLAMKHGRTPNGGFYFPAFPYRAYAGLSDQDALDIAAFLMTQPAIRNEVPAHQTPAWLARWMMAGWNLLADITQRGHAQSAENIADPLVARGAYLARNLGHCGECHTPRNALGIPDLSREFAGAPFENGTIKGMDAEAMQNWSEEDFAFLLFLGMKPDGEFVGGKMEAVIEHNTSQLTAEDRAAMAAFFKRQQGQ